MTIKQMAFIVGYFAARIEQGQYHNLVRLIELTEDDGDPLDAAAFLAALAILSGRPLSTHSEIDDAVHVGSIMHIRGELGYDDVTAMIDRVMQAVIDFGDSLTLCN